MNSNQPEPVPETRCTSCGRPVPPDAPGDSCPRCLLGAAVGPGDTALLPEPSAPLPAAASPPGPTTFGDYELLEELGRGGMGVVWRARHRNLGREVALKLVLQGAFASAVDRQRFQSEARAVAALDHPGIVPIYEVGEHESRPFFAMRLVRGGSLASGALRSGLDVRRGAEIVARIARAVHHAHQRGVLHRDLKPANILVDAGEPVVADFGLAKRLGEASDAGATATGAVIGSPAYMAPEQAAGKTREISTASDVYSLGAILYELLSGEPPFRADTPLATLRLVTETEPAPLRGRGRAIDRNLETICLKCLAKLPRDRYGSAEAVAEDLERWLRRESIQARRVPFWERGWNWTRRHPNLALAVVAVTATAATGLAAFLGQFRRTQEALEQARATALAERSARAAVIAPERTWNFASEVRVATPSPDGTRLLVASGTNAHVLALPSGEPLASFVGHTGSVRIARWSGDGRRVLTVSTCQEQPVWDDPNGPYGDGTIRVWDASNGGTVAHMDNPLADIVMSAAISRDGRLVAIGAVHGQAAWWKPDADEAPTLWDAFDVQIRGLDFDPRDRYLVATPGDLVTWIRRPMPNGGSFGHIGFHAETPARLFALGSTQEIGSVQPVTRMRMRHWEIVHAKPRPIETTRAVAAFAPDGEWFVTGGSHPPNTAIWSSPDARLLHRLSGHTQAVSCVAISRDGSRVATGGDDRAVHVRDARSGHLLGRLGPHPRNVRYIEFAPEMRWALTVCADQKIRIWDVEEGVCVALLRGHNGPVHEAHFVDGGERVVSASADRTLRLWRWATFEQMAQGLDGHATEIRSVAFDPAGRRVAAGAFDGTARVWDLERGRGRPEHLLDPGPDYGVGCEATIRANGGGQMRGVAFSADGSRLVTARTDPVFSRTFDLSVLLRSRWIARAPTPLPWTPGRVWDVASGRAVGAIGATNLAFAGVSSAPDGRSLLFRGDAMPRQASRRGIWRFEEMSYSHGYGRSPFGHAELFEYPSLRRLAVLDGHAGELQTAAYSPDGSHLLTADFASVRLWDERGVFRRELPDAEGRDWTQFSPDGRLVLSQDREKVATTFDVATGLPVRRFPAIAKATWEAWFAGDGSEVGAIDTLGHLATYDTGTGALLWQGQGSGVNTGRTLVSPDRRWLATVVGEQTVDLWDLRARRRVRSLDRHVHSVTELAFAPDGRWLATGDASGKIWVWPLRLADESPETKTSGPPVTRSSSGSSTAP